MTDQNTTRAQALYAELELHKTEFSTLRDEILRAIDAERQSLNLTLVAMGAGLGLIPLIVEQNVLIILLLFPLVFHIILWEMLHSIKVVTRISEYLTGVLIPRVNGILDELGGPRPTTTLGWEGYIAALSTKTGGIVVASITPTRHWMPILAIGALVAAYSIIVRQLNVAPTPAEIGLVFFNLLLLLWAAAQNALTVRAGMQQARRLRQATRPVEAPGEPPKPARGSKQSKGGKT